MLADSNLLYTLRVLKKPVRLESEIDMWGPPLEVSNEIIKIVVKYNYTTTILIIKIINIAESWCKIALQVVLVPDQAVKICN
jgi:hypothetical protein